MIQILRPTWPPRRNRKTVGAAGVDGVNSIVQVLESTSTAAVNSVLGIAPGAFVQTNCSVDVTSTGGRIRLDARMRVATIWGTLGVTVLRDGVNMNSADTNEPIWLYQGSVLLDINPKTASFSVVDSPAAGTYTYDLVVCQASSGFNVQNGVSPCSLLAKEMTTS
jgi:hypothetical protein